MFYLRPTKVPLKTTLDYKKTLEIVAYFSLWHSEAQVSITSLVKGCTANKGFHVKKLWQRGIHDIRHKNVIPDLKIIFNPDGPIVKLLIYKKNKRIRQTSIKITTVQNHSEAAIRRCSSK